MYESLNIPARQLLRAIDRNFSRWGTSFVFISILKSALGFAIMAFILTLIVKLFTSLDLMLWQGPVYWGIFVEQSGAYFGALQLCQI